ncbi:MAG TPA: serine/threonine-protein kinase [Terriglobales bacterium]|nr:serine/threonine-protein kinase [Terriglobales bacterium]
MAKCGSCGTSVSERARFCSSCGATISSHDAVTATFSPPEATPVARERAGSKPELASSRSGENSEAARRVSPSGLASQGRFLPGALLAARYRIVALLGQGGMGEVYRADDLVLGQAVALKFLPPSAANDEELLQRFRNEVRMARRVSHANVCRVHDVGEAEGQTFLSMEYVDGEDLRSLLRRIGRLPPDKAVEIARQLCAGLGAAHREGVLHRDLKPANIMLDGRGHAVITDFGLAALADQIRSPEVRSGTPAYMSPEQLAGREVTEKSDLYALGLVLYEIFTGRRAFEAETLAEIVRVRQEGPVSHPSSWVKDLDPAVERVMMRCLEPDPAKRPASPLAVAAALPGGDPLGAALAAGETPSPEMVAAAGEREGIRPRVAVAGMAAVILGLAIIALIGIAVNGFTTMPRPLPPEVLTVKAQEIIQSLGYSEQPVDQAGQWYYQTEITDYLEEHEAPRPDWANILSHRPLVLLYGYRQSPVYLDPSGYQGLSLTPGVVEFDDPPAIQSGMINLTVDSRGRLTYFQAIPNEFDPSPPPAGAVDWKPLFSAAQIDLAQLHPAEPQWVSLAAFDARAAWTGTWPDSGRPLRVEAAAWRGRPVYFSLLGPWTKPTRMQHSTTTAGERAGQIVESIIAMVLWICGAWIARRNYAGGKSDLRGALYLTTAVFLLEMAIWVCRDHFIPTLATLRRLVLAMSTGGWLAAFLGMLYLALEPYVRRRWPQAIVSWSRLMRGRWRDPLVGRDVLWGVTLGIVWSLMIGVGLLLLKRMGVSPNFPSQACLTGGRQLLGIWLLNVVQCIAGTLELFFVAFLLRIVLHNQWLAAVGFVAFFATINTIQNGHAAILAPIWVVVFSIAAYAVTRFGLITFATALFTANILLNVPYTLEFSNWYASNALAVVLSFVALAGWGSFTSLAGQKLFPEDLFQ